MIAPPAKQCAEIVRHHDVRVRLRSLVLPELPAAPMLEDPAMVCFATGADAGAWTADELCERAARALRQKGASYYELHLAMVGALMRGRYKEMVKAMQAAAFEPVIIEDLVKFGEDIGFEKGLVEGLRKALFAVLAGRGLRLGPKSKQRVAAEGSSERLQRWLERAPSARSAREVFAD